MKMNAAFSICILASLTVVSPARAADTGWFVGADVGQSRYDLSQFGDFVAPELGTDVTRDDHDSAYKLSAGYEFNRFLDVEANYADLGQASVDRRATIIEPDRDTDEQMIVDAKGWGVDVEGKYPFTEQWSVDARVGAFDGRVRFRYLANGGFVLNTVLDDSATKWKPTYGIGMDWSFASQWTARLGWDRYHQLGDSSLVGEYDVDVYSFGIVYRFF